MNRDEEILEKLNALSVSQHKILKEQHELKRVQLEMEMRVYASMQGRQTELLSVLVAWVEELPELQDMKVIDQQRQRIVAYWRALAYDERDENYLRRCFYQYQQDMVLLLDMLYEKSRCVLDDADPGTKKVVSALMACLEALLEFVEHWRPQFFNMEQRAPECIRLRKMLELEAEIGLAESEAARVLLPTGCTYAELRTAKDITSEDMRFIEDLPDEMTPEEMAVMNRYLRMWGGFKLHIRISVALFGLLLGTLIKVEVFEPDERERDVIMKFFAQHMRTDKSSNISFKSLGNHSYSTDVRLLGKMIRLCERMISELRENMERPGD